MKTYYIYLLLSLLALGACNEEKIEIVVLSTNDVHSRVNPFPENDRKNPSKGGFAERMNVINKTREENKNVLLLDAGDVSQGTPFFNAFGGDFQIECMNKMGYDAMTIGNHEFDNGMEALAQTLKKANFPIICSNYNFEETPLNGLTKPYAILIKQGIKIGIIGLGVELEGLVGKENFGKTHYLDPIQQANKYADKLKSRGCKLIIALSHLGFEDDQGKICDIMLAQKTKNINLIIGGHTHTFMNVPYYELNLIGNKVAIIQSGYAGINIAKTKFTLNSREN